MENKEHFINQILIEALPLINKSFNIYEAQKLELKNMKQDFAYKLKDNYRYNQLTDKENHLKKTIQGLKEQLVDCKGEQEEVKRSFEEFKTINDFQIKADTDFLISKDK